MLLFSCSKNLAAYILVYGFKHGRTKSKLNLDKTGAKARFLYLVLRNYSAITIDSE